jgi:Sec-independent protein translocase protein TatA
MGKDLGKIAGSLKAEAQTFSSAMQESLEEAEKGVNEVQKEEAKPVTAAKKEEPAAPAAKPGVRVCCVMYWDSSLVSWRVCGFG